MLQPIDIVCPLCRAHPGANCFHVLKYSGMHFARYEKVIDILNDDLQRRKDEVQTGIEALKLNDAQNAAIIADKDSRILQLVKALQFISNAVNKL